MRRKYGHDEAKNKDRGTSMLMCRTRYRCSRLHHDLRAARPGDVLLAWENEAFLALREFGDDKFDIVVPSLSIKRSPPVAIVDVNVDAKGTRKVGRLSELPLSPRRKSSSLTNYYRPSNPAAGRSDEWRASASEASCDRRSFIRGWGKVQPTHFADGGVFDRSTSVELRPNTVAVRVALR